jgi:hypothetical protein
MGDDERYRSRKDVYKRGNRSAEYVEGYVVDTRSKVEGSRDPTSMLPMWGLQPHPRLRQGLPENASERHSPCSRRDQHQEAAKGLHVYHSTFKLH